MADEKKPLSREGVADELLVSIEARLREEVGRYIGLRELAAKAAEIGGDGVIDRDKLNDELGRMSRMYPELQRIVDSHMGPTPGLGSNGSRLLQESGLDLKPYVLRVITGKEEALRTRALVDEVRSVLSTDGKEATDDEITDAIHDAHREGLLEREGWARGTAYRLKRKEV